MNEQEENRLMAQHRRATHDRLRVPDYDERHAAARQFAKDRMAEESRALPDGQFYLAQDMNRDAESFAHLYAGQLVQLSLEDTWARTKHVHGLMRWMKEVTC